MKKSVTSPIHSGLNIERSEGKANIYETAWIIIGPPGVGKSTLGSGFEGALFICSSKKELTSLQSDYILVETWEQILNVTDELINNRVRYSKYKFLIFDFIDAMFTMCDIAVCEKLGVSHKTDAGYGKGTDTIDGYFKKWITKLVASSYGCIFISHVIQKDVIIQGGSVTKTICTLPPRARNILFPLINVIGCIEYKTMKIPSTIDGGRPSMQRKRVMTFEATEYVEAKDRDGVLPSEIILAKDPKLNFQVFKDYYEGRRVRKG